MTAHVGIGPHNARGFSLTVRLQVRLPGIDPTLARTLVDAMYNDICPDSHATRDNVEVAVEPA